MRPRGRLASEAACAAVVAVAACGPSARGPAEPPRAPQAYTIAGAPELFAKGIVSSEYSEIRLAISPDGTTMLWGSTDRPGGPGGWNIWLVRKTAGGWSAPAPAPFDSDANDFDPAYSADGKWVYFFSNRPGGLGGDDIYRVPVTGDSFGPAEHLGPDINTPGDEWAPAPSPDGTQLMFASGPPKGKHDLFVAPLAGGPAKPLAWANTPTNDEFDATWLPDGRSIIFSRSTDVENDPILLYLAAPDRPPAPLAFDIADGYQLGPSIDHGMLYFSSHRPEASAGKLDIYRIRSTP